MEHLQKTPPSGSRIPLDLSQLLLAPQLFPMGSEHVAGV
jgi:hypothetical protein